MDTCSNQFQYRSNYFQYTNLLMQFVDLKVMNSVFKQNGDLSHFLPAFISRLKLSKMSICGRVA